MHDHLTIPSPEGTISISPDAIADIVGETAAQCYGVVGLSGGNAVKRLLRRGVAIAAGKAGIAIDLHVVVEYGLNLAEVAATVRSQVSYEVERLTGLKVEAVQVHIQDVRRSA